MTDAPRIIYAAPSPDKGWMDGFCGEWPSPMNPQDTLYIRADALTIDDCRDVPEVREMVRLIKEVAPVLIDDLEASINAEYRWPNVHPSQSHKYMAEMELVNEFRAALRALEGGF